MMRERWMGWCVATSLACVSACVSACASDPPALRARATSPGNASGVALLARGLNEQAKAAFERALDEALRGADAPAEIDARLSLAVLFMEASDRARAMQHLDLAIDRMIGRGALDTEDSAVSWIVAAEVATAVGHREAQDLLAAGAKQLGSDAGLLLALAACARGDVGDADDARAVKRFERAERDMLQLRVLRCGARAAWRRGERDTALAYADRAVELDKRSHDSRSLRDDLALGARVLEHGDRASLALQRWLEVARIDVAMGHAEGLEDVASAITAIAERTTENDRRRASAVIADLRERLARSTP
jgi:tetratricopeptide (TPR) repeat protein